MSKCYEGYRHWDKTAGGVVGEGSRGAVWTQSLGVHTSHSPQSMTRDEVEHGREQRSREWKVIKETDQGQVIQNIQTSRERWVRGLKPLRAVDRCIFLLPWYT